MPRAVAAEAGARLWHCEAKRKVARPGTVDVQTGQLLDSARYTAKKADQRGRAARAARRRPDMQAIGQLAVAIHDTPDRPRRLQPCRANCASKPKATRGQAIARYARKRPICQSSSARRPVHDPRGPRVGKRIPAPEWPMRVMSGERRGRAGGERGRATRASVEPAGHDLFKWRKRCSDQVSGWVPL